MECTGRGGSWLLDLRTSDGLPDNGQFGLAGEYCLSSAGGGSDATMAARMAINSLTDEAARLFEGDGNSAARAIEGGGRCDLHRSADDDPAVRPQAARQAGPTERVAAGGLERNPAINGKVCAAQ